MIVGDLSLSKFEYQEIYPHIFVYKNFFPDHKRLYQVLKDSSYNSDGKFVLSEWKDWFVFGSYCYEKNIDYSNDRLLNNFYNETPVQFDGLFNEEYNLTLRVKGAAVQAISHYIGANSVKLPENSFFSKPNYAKYRPEIVIGFNKTQEMTMNFHTDYNIGEWFWENENFLITSTIYMNDNYNGGEICFFINGDFVTYKPAAGDVLVFPSGSPLYAPDNNPYFHAVNKVYDGEKYLIRSYVKYPQKRK